MPESILRRARKWLTPAEAAIELATALGEDVSAADVLRLVLDGHLTISVRLPASRDDQYFKRPEDDRDLATTSRLERVLPLWLEGAGRRQVEAEFHRLSGLPALSMAWDSGACVWFDGGLQELQTDIGNGGLSPRPAAAIPYGSTLVITRTDLEATVAKLRSTQPESSAGSPASQPSAPKAEDRPLQTRERTTLLLLIAALAREDKMDLSKPFKAAEALATSLSAAGHTVAPRTIGEHLKAANEAWDPEGKPRR